MTASSPAPPSSARPWAWRRRTRRAALRQLAHRLAGSGWAALRIDYAATGDSVGTWTDPDLVAEWLGNIRLAIDCARALGAERVGVVGLRLGATLAAAELARGGPVDDLVLWDPCATGRAFLREQRAMAAFRREMAGRVGAMPEGEVRAPAEVERGRLGRGTGHRVLRCHRGRPRPAGGRVE